MNLIRYVRPGNNFEPSFPIFSRSDVNGAARIPVYQWALVRLIPSGNICNNYRIPVALSLPCGSLLQPHLSLSLRSHVC